MADVRIEFFEVVGLDYTGMDPLDTPVELEANIFQYTPKGKKLATIRRVIRAVGLTSVVGLGIMSYYGVVPRNIGIRLRDIVKTANSTLIGNIRSLS